MKNMMNMARKALAFGLAATLFLGVALAYGAPVAHEHDWDEGVVVSTSTCSAKGVKIVTCKVEGCGATKSVELPVNAEAHNWSKWVVTKAATCSQTGVETRTCSRDRRHTETRVVPMTAHVTASANNDVAATCEAAGKESDTICLVCGKTVAVGAAIPATGKHSFVWKSDSVNHWKECADCGATEGAKAAHTGGKATCGAPAVCTVCGAAYSGSTGHDYEDIVTKATCTSRGYVTHVCRSCGQSYVDQETPALGHTEILDPGTPATCTEAGKTDGKHCAVCGRTTLKQEVIPAAGHTMVTDAAVRATCHSTGLTEGSHCAVCGLVKTAQTVIPVSDHVAGDWLAVTPSVCLEGGKQEQRCIFCDKLMGSREVSALGHDFSAWHTDEDGHCAACARCGEEKAREEHSWDAGSVVAPADYGMEGIVRHTCVCGATYVERIPALRSETVIVISGGAAEAEEPEELDEIEDLGDEDVPMADLPFAPYEDVAENAWSAKSVAFVYNYGLMDGVSEEVFAPTVNSDRATIVAALYRLEKAPKVTAANPFKDVAEDAWYRDAAVWAARWGITTGTSATAFTADGTCTREQAVTFLYRYAQLKHISLKATGDLSGFADGETVSGYAVQAMTWAVSNGLIQGSAGKLVPQGILTREQLAAILYRFSQTFMETVL